MSIYNHNFIFTPEVQGAKEFNGKECKSVQRVLIFAYLFLMVACTNAYGTANAYSATALSRPSYTSAIEA
jgi:hypothetical protein